MAENDDSLTDFTLGRLGALSFAMRAMTSLFSDQERERYNKMLDAAIKRAEEKIKLETKYPDMWKEYRELLTMLKQKDS